MTNEKDDVHWITGQELREIYADDLSLDKYDEIRNRASPAPAKILPEKPCDICLLNDLAANDYEKLAAHDAEVAETAAAEARKDERVKVLLKYQNWIAKEAKMVFCGETKAFIVRLNSKLVDEIESLRTPQQHRQRSKNHDRR